MQQRERVNNCGWGINLKHSLNGSNSETAREKLNKSKHNNKKTASKKIALLQRNVTVLLPILWSCTDLTDTACSKGEASRLFLQVQHTQKNFVSLDFATGFRATWMIHKKSTPTTLQPISEAHLQKSLLTRIGRTGSSCGLQPLEKKARRFLHLYKTMRVNSPKEDYSASWYQFDYRTYV